MPRDHNDHLLYARYDFARCTICRLLREEARRHRASLDLPVEVSDHDLVIRYLYHRQKMSET